MPCALTILSLIWKKINSISCQIRLCHFTIIKFPPGWILSKLNQMLCHSSASAESPSFYLVFFSLNSYFRQFNLDFCGNSQLPTVISIVCLCVGDCVLRSIMFPNIEHFRWIKSYFKFNFVIRISQAHEIGKEQTQKKTKKDEESTFKSREFFSHLYCLLVEILVHTFFTRFSWNCWIPFGVSILLFCAMISFIACSLLR